ncbi:Aste57867_15322 [Aphanomyces stellatus]|uniref:Aste57867_15322 protein n=1 Tax=Aphanomyces stellatus TaxID=120398 RepID=A0A485L5R7_9STRA|nr:hypothetical protein As57867_015266 [Aphanomyces stellatus]VFT92131.1 Aste57867_15322 [Aphanomyces stellatus]
MPTTGREMTDEQRQIVFQTLHELKQGDGRVPYGAMKNLSERFGVSQQAISRVWTRGCQTKASTGVANVAGRKKGNCGRRPNVNLVRVGVPVPPEVLASMAQFPLTDVKSHFWVHGSGANRRVSCMHCGMIIETRSHERWAAHLTWCPESPMAIKKVFQKPNHLPKGQAAAAPHATDEKPMRGRRLANLMDRAVTLQNGATAQRYVAADDVKSKSPRHDATTLPSSVAESIAFPKYACLEVRAFQEALGPQYYAALDLLADATLARTFVVLAHEDRLGWLQWKLRPPSPA